MYIEITVLTVGEGICLYSQENEFSAKARVLDLLLQTLAEFSFSQYIPPHRHIADLFQLCECLNGDIVPFLGSQPSDRQDPYALEIVFKAFSLVCHPADSVLIDQVMKDPHFLFIFRIDFQIMLLHFIRHGEDLVKSAVAVQIQLSCVSGFAVIDMDECGFFLCFYMVRDIIGCSALQIGDCKIVFFPDPRGPVRKQSPAQLVRQDFPGSSHHAKVFHKIRRPPEEQTFSDSGFQHAFHQKVSSFFCKYGYILVILIQKPHMTGQFVD